MEPKVVKTKLVEVLQRIQEVGGFEDGASVDGDTVPLDDLEEFDTHLAPVAITVLSKELGVPIPNDENVFLSADGEKRLSVDEVVNRVLDVVNRKGKKR